MDISILLLILAILGASVAIGSIVLWSIWNGIAPMPSSYKAQRKIEELLPRLVQGPIYELGSGWGTLAFLLAKRYPHQPVIGYETSPIPFWISRILLKFKYLHNLTLKRKDFFEVPLNDASLVVCYLYPGAMHRLKVKFERELQPGTWILSNTFAIPGWTPVQMAVVEDLYRTKIYLYRI